MKTKTVWRLFFMSIALWISFTKSVLFAFLALIFFQLIFIEEELEKLNAKPPQ